jgi:hypothetical protein
MTRKLNIDKAYSDTVDRRPAGNSGFAKKRVQWLIVHSTSHQLLWFVDGNITREQEDYINNWNLSHFLKLTLIKHGIIDSLFHLVSPRKGKLKQREQY